MPKNNIGNMLKQHILCTANFSRLPNFISQIEKLDTLEELINWLGNTDFSSTHSGEYAAVTLLITAANTIQHVTALEKFTEWAKQQEITSHSFSDVAMRDIRLLEEELLLLKKREVIEKESPWKKNEHFNARYYQQETFEKVYSLAPRMISDNPTLRPKLAQWVLSLQSI